MRMTRKQQKAMFAKKRVYAFRTSEGWTTHAEASSPKAAYNKLLKKPIATGGYLTRVYAPYSKYYDEKAWKKLKL